MLLTFKIFELDKKIGQHYDNAFMYLMSYILCIFFFIENMYDIM